MAAPLKDKHQTILESIAAHARRPARLMAVSKRHGPEKVRELATLGQREFGENYAQELAEKAEALSDLPLTWIYIGHLQSNKLRKIVACATEIQTVSSFRHAEQIARHATELGKLPYPIFIEVNAGDEAGKSGIAQSELPALAARIQTELPALRLRGVMAIPPSIYSDAAFPEVPELYRELRRLADQTGEGQLSLGMSGDLRIALEAGSDQVRIGTAIFGERPS